MKAVQFDRYGGPEVLRLTEMTDPSPSAGEVLIRVRAIGVNPADGKWRAGRFEGMLPLSLPHVGGYDVAGEVVGGDALPAGTRVAAMLDPHRAGAYAELVAADAARVAVLPDGLDFAIAAALPTPGLTGVQAMEEELAIGPGQRVLITGAVGAVGRCALFAAKAAGATGVAAVREAAREQAIALGADEVLALDGRDHAGAQFDGVLDTVGGAVVAPLCRAVSPGGRIITAATTPIPADGVPVEIRFFAVHADADRLRRLLDWAARGDVAVPIAATLPLARAAEAHRRVEAGGAGKIILLP